MLVLVEDLAQRRGVEPVPETRLAAVAELGAAGQHLATGGLHQVRLGLPRADPCSRPQAHEGPKARQMPDQELFDGPGVAFGGRREEFTAVARCRHRFPDHLIGWHENQAV